MKSDPDSHGIIINIDMIFQSYGFIKIVFIFIPIYFFEHQSSTLKTRMSIPALSVPLLTL